MASRRPNRGGGAEGPQIEAPDGARAAVPRVQDAARGAALVSNIGFGVGIVGVAVGAFLVLRSPSSSAPASAVRVTPSFGQGAAGASLWGVF